MNKAIKLLMFSDIFVVTGFGLMEPILAIFIKENLAGGTILAAGIASTLFLITKSAVQLPFSRYVDSHEGKVQFLLLGTALVAVVPFLYIFSETVHSLYAAQILYGIGSGLAYPTWLGLWSRHLDDHEESFEWSLYSSIVGISTAMTAIIGALIAEAFGFTFTFAVVGAMAVLGCFVLLGLEKELHGVPITRYQQRRLLTKRH